MENSIINFGNALGWSIIHSIWQASIWYILYSLYILVQPSLSAKNKHNAAFGTQISIFISFILTFIYFYRSPEQVLDLRTLNPEELKNLMIIGTQEGFKLENLLPYVVVGYVFGFLVQVILLFNSLIKLRTLKYKGLDSIPENWKGIYSTAKTKLKVTKSVGLYLSNKISVPITLGHIKPFILFPLAYANKMEPAQIEAILLHELAHVKRHDYLFNLLKVGIETILFFNPFVWALSKVMEREREHACDDMVVAHISTPITYAQALVELEELRMSLHPALTMAATGNKNHLFKRIKRITKMETNYKNVRPQLMAVILSGIALLLLAIIIPINETTAQEKEIKTSETNNNAEIIIEQVGNEIKLIEQPAVKVAPAPKEPVKIAYKGSVIKDTSELPLEVRNMLRSIESNSKKIQEYYNSPEWKAQVAKISETSLRMKEKFDSPKGKKMIKDMEENGKKVSSYFERSAWKQQVANIEKEAGQVEKYFNSPEWKQQVKKMEESGKEVASYFESADWKDQMAKIEKETAKVQNHFNSAAWKEQLKKIESDSKKVQEYFESPEWKEKVQK
jgi:beta-lactamase regulating signal transducer with metallopeptidase domain